MENDKNIYKIIFKNQENRIILIKELEDFVNNSLYTVETLFKQTGQVQHEYTTKFNEYSMKTLQALQSLNDELKNIKESSSNEVKKNIDILLGLEKDNYQLTISIFLDKIKCFDMIQKEEDESIIIKKEKEINNNRETLSTIREQISDFINDLKYKYL